MPTKQENDNLRQCIAALEIAKNTPCEEDCGFSMYQYAHTCGTPSCVLGWLTVLGDRQPFKLGPDPDDDSMQTLLWADTGETISYYSKRFQDHFGLDVDEGYELFGSEGCDGAQTPDDAIAYIRNFMEERGGEV
jgi:hypothetical protein